MRNKNYKFYVGHAKLVEDYDGWRDKTFEDALKRAKGLMDKNGTEELLIVKVVGIVKRDSPPIKVERLK